MPAHSGASVFAEDTLFATLDPTIRSVRLPGGSKAVLSDTVGFISNLPTQLVAAFRATLEEVLEADLILHVRDIADHASSSQRADVIAVLEGLGIAAEAEPDRIIEVWNKADLLDDVALKRLDGEAHRAGAALVSAVKGFGLDTVRAAIEKKLNRARETIEIRLKPDEGSLSNWIYENCEVVARLALDDGITALRIRVPPEKRDRLARLAGPARLRLAAE